MTHQPKTAALIAYAEGLLSDEGQRRIRVHLDGCDVCQRELASIELYERMVDDVRDAEVPALDFDRMDLDLAREARSVSGSIRSTQQVRRWGPWVVAGLAAAAILAFYISRPEPTPVVAHRDTAHSPRAREPVAPMIDYLEPVVTLTAGDVAVYHGHTLAVGDRLTEGDALEVLDRSEAHVRLAEGAALVASADTLLGLERARVEEVRLRLRRGRVSSSVTPFASGSSFVVLAARHEIRATGTRFTVFYLEDEGIGVDLAEGELEITPPEGDVISLTAPARWRSVGAEEGEPEVRVPHQPTAVDNPLTLVTLRHPELVRWDVAGTVVESSGELQLRLRHGEHRVQGWDASGALHVATLEVADAPVMMDEGTIRPEAPRVRAGHLEPAAIQAVVARGRRSLTQCQQLVMRETDAITGHARIRVTIGITGEVERVRIRDLPETGRTQLRECFDRVVRRWTFPAPSPRGEVTFELPVSLGTRR